MVLGQFSNYLRTIDPQIIRKLAKTHKIYGAAVNQNHAFYLSFPNTIRAKLGAIHAVASDL
jgi:hypothetical protein